jgi:hypothetical protein
MTLIAVYVGCLVLGGIFIGASVMGGPGHADGGADVDHGADHGTDHGAEADHGADHAHDHEHALTHDRETSVAKFGADAAGVLFGTLLSIRFWTFGLATFGLTGVLLHLLGFGAILSAPVAAATGVGIGGAAASIMRALSKRTVTAATGTRELAGREGDVVLSVGPDKIGKVRLHHQGQTLELLATTREPRRVARGERVLVVEDRAGQADITPITPAHPHPNEES